jgi:L-ascorbate metabolism protein UlaG (beta-lactamase superfamily)
MNNGGIYLKPNVQVEPLFARWYVWSYLIPPATAARNVTERHMKIMESYINAPMIHANAVKNPQLRGGPFIDHGGKRVDEIKDLRRYTKDKLRLLFDLSNAIAELDHLLRAKATGLSLEPLYASVPDLLRGYVEIGYDLNNHASFRLIEPLLYRSPYYHEAEQSFMLSLITHDGRPFILSTPRLDDDKSVHLRVPYRDAIIDELFTMKTRPSCWSHISDVFDGHASSTELLHSLFTEEAPKPYESYKGSGVRWRYFGHACILVESNGVSLLLDPALSYTYESEISRYTYQDIPEQIDYVLITHNHQDHLLFETLLQLRHKIKHIIVPRNGGGALHDPSVKGVLEAVGFCNVLELSDMQTLDITNGSITALPFLGEHSDLTVHTKLAYLVDLGKHRLLFVADSCNMEPRLYEHAHRDVGDVDVLFLGMECDGAPLHWLYGPLLTQNMPRAMVESRRLSGSNFEQGFDLVRRFGCKNVYVYAMGQEPWLNHLMSIRYTPESRPIVESNKLIEECRAHGIEAERLFGEREILLS